MTRDPRPMDAGLHAADLPPFVSVIIPVFRDPEGIRRCVEMLEAQTYAAERYEIIVVDNGGNGALSTTLASFRHVTVVSEARPSQFAARNRGIAVATGTVLAFTDADCHPAADWIAQGVAALLHAPTRGLVGGAIEFSFRAPAAPTAAELYDSRIFLQQERLVREARFAVTANLFTWRRIVDEVGPFDASLRSGADADFGRRVRAGGYALHYASAARIVHPARATWSALYAKVARTTGGEVIRRRRDGVGAGAFVRETAIDLTAPVWLPWRVALDGRLRGWRQRLQFFIAAIFARYVRAWERARILAGGAPRR